MSLAYQRLDAAGARKHRDVVAEIFADSYEPGEDFDSPEAFMERFDRYSSREGLDLIIGFAGDEPVGQTWGWPLDRASGEAWWRGLQTPVDPDFTREDGHRTFALSEIMVRRPWTGKGVAHALHDELLHSRPEERATLLAEPDNPAAYRAYTAWGWQKAAELRPSWPDAPLFDVLILPLPLT